MKREEVSERARGDGAEGGGGWESFLQTSSANCFLHAARVRGRAGLSARRGRRTSRYGPCMGLPVAAKPPCTPAPQTPCMLRRCPTDFSGRRQGSRLPRPRLPGLPSMRAVRKLLNKLAMPCFTWVGRPLRLGGRVARGTAAYTGAAGLCAFFPNASKILVCESEREREGERERERIPSGTR